MEVNMKSADFNTKEAPIKIWELMTKEEVQSFIEGDERKTVIDAAAKRIKELTPKEGQDERMTKDSDGFKKDIQREKVTGNDVLANLRAKGYRI
jgi:hypothetical protein